MSAAIIRAQLPHVVPQFAYFDNASIGPMASRTQAAMDAFTAQKQRPPFDMGEASAAVARCRAQLAALVGAGADEIAFTGSVAHGLNLAAWSIPFGPRDNIIFCDREFPSNVYPWMNLAACRGLEARCIPNDGGGLTVAALEAHADRNIRAVAVSSVEFSDGYRNDLEAIGRWCRAHGAWFIVDGAQSLGVLPMDVQKYQIDFLAGCSAKWLMGPFGLGFVYIRRERFPQLRPPMPGCDSVQNPTNWLDYRLDWQDGADRFESGAINLPGVVGLSASLGLLAAAGWPVIYQNAQNLAKKASTELFRLGYDVAGAAQSDATRSGIVSFKTKDTEATCEKLKKANVLAAARCGYVRLGIHGYNTENDLDRLFSALQ